MTPLEDPMPTPGSWRDPKADKPLSSAACLQLLAETPPWRLGPSNAELVRTVRFATRLSALYYLGIVLDFARHLAVEPHVHVHGVDVTVRIGRPTERGLTRRDFQLARRISLVEEK
ncbi:MAG: 4a-hydroxytetrahydrobiopterin dehydratase [Nitrospira sp.]|nr:4a-hydroxytetrahydrobiopterin dehydratase [Nitrospira sp.]